MGVEIQVFGKKLGKEVDYILRKIMSKAALTFCTADGEWILLREEAGGESCCIFNSSCPESVKLAQQSGCRTLSCGFSAYDTLVLSSSTMEQAVVSLQRKIHTLSGQTLEPGDYLIYKSEEYSDQALLFSAAVLLLLDETKLVFEF